MPRRSLQLVLYGLGAFFLLMLVGAAWLATNTIGRIEAIQSASENLEVRNYRIAANLRAQVYRLGATSLRHQVSGDASFLSRFERYRVELNDFIDAEAPALNSPEEKELVTRIRARLDEYLAELGSLAGPDPTGMTADTEINQLENLVGEITLIARTIDNGEGVDEILWRLQRAQAALLLGFVGRDHRATQRFREYCLDLLAEIGSWRSTIDPSRAPKIDDLVAKTIEYNELGATFLARSAAADTPGNLPGMEKMMTLRDEIIELTQALGDARRGAFRDALARYRDSVSGLQYSVYTALSLLVLALGVLAWLAHHTFIRPLHERTRSAEDRAAEIGELANLGTLASGIAHEIRNPLAAMKARIFALTELVEPDSPAARQASVVDSEVNRLDRIVREFLDFARPAEPDPEKLAVTGFLEGLGSLVGPELDARGITLGINGTIDPNLSALIDRAQMQQVFLNLIRNAADACPEEGGRISLDAIRTDSGNPALLVRDNGSGIPRAFQNRIFEPFFSKKKGGTGLGLPICRSIVRKHGGDLTFESSEGNGTVFTITLLPG